MKINKTFLIIILAIILITHCHEGHDHDHDHDHHDHHHDNQQQNQHAPKYQQISNVLHLTDSNLEAAKAQFPLLFVKFFAPWCGHCRHMAELYTELATETAAQPDNQYVFAEVDCTIHKVACNEHGIQGYPTLKYYIDGKQIAYKSQRTKQAIKQWIVSTTKEVREPPQAIGESAQQL